MRARIERIVPWYRVIGYAIALLAVLFATAVRFGLEPWLGGRAHYLVFVVAVLVAAVFGGRLPAIFAAALSVLSVNLLESVGRRAPSAFVELVTFAGTSAIVIWLVHLIMRLRQQSVRDEGRARRGEETATRLVEERDLLIDGVPGHALILLGPDGHVRIWSKGAERLLHWSEEEAVGRNGTAFHPALDLPRATREHSFAVPATLFGKDGRVHQAEVVTAALNDANGWLRGYALMIRTD